MPLARGAIFENVETPEGRVQSAFERSDPVPPDAVPAEWRATARWLFAPVAAELPEAWAEVPPPTARVALGWQGLLRELVPGDPVRHVAPAPSAIVRRSELIVVGADDLGRTVDLPALAGILAPDSTLVLTRGAAGGIVFSTGPGGLRPVRRFPAIPSTPRDPTGAGDIFVASLVAAAFASATRTGSRVDGDALRFAATVAAISVEGLGLDAVPDTSAIRRRLATHLAFGRD